MYVCVCVTRRCVYDLCLYRFASLNLYNGMCLCTMNKCSLTNKTPH